MERCFSAAPRASLFDDVLPFAVGFAAAFEGGAAVGAQGGLFVSQALVFLAPRLCRRAEPRHVFGAGTAKPAGPVAAQPHAQRVVHQGNREMMHSVEIRAVTNPERAPAMTLVVLLRSAAAKRNDESKNQRTAAAAREAAGSKEALVRRQASHEMQNKGLTPACRRVKPL